MKAKPMNLAILFFGTPPSPLVLVIEKLQNHSFLNFEFRFLAKVFGQENKCQFHHPSSQNVSCYVSHRNANFIPEKPQWEGPRERVLGKKTRALRRLKMVMNSLRKGGHVCWLLEE